MKLLLLFALCGLAAAAPKNTTECDQCLQVVKYVDSDLTANSTAEEIEHFINRICEKLGSASEECESYVKQYVPEVLKMLAARVKPERICAELHLCNKTEEVQQPVINLPLGPGPVIGGNGLDIPGMNSHQKEPIMPAAIELPVHEEQHQEAPRDEKCILCEFVMKELQSILGANATEQEIEAALDKVCNILPKTIQSECTSFVNQYAPQIIQILANKLDPEQACTALGLCSNSSSTLHHSGPFFAQGPRRVGAGPLCPICEQVMKYVDNLLANNATDQQILETIERICQYLPQADQDQCKQLIEQEGEKIIQMLVNKLAPQQICEALKLC